MKAEVRSCNPERFACNAFTHKLVYPCNTSSVCVYLGEEIFGKEEEGKGE